jgi:hypothetical protein
MYIKHYLPLTKPLKKLASPHMHAILLRLHVRLKTFEGDLIMAYYTPGRSSGRVRKPLSPVYLILAGIALSAFGVFFYFHQQSFLEKAQETTGRVTKIEQTTRTSRTDGVSRTVYEYRPVVEFALEGRGYTFRGDTSQSANAYAEGQEVAVLYNAENPSDAQIKSDSRQMTNFLFMGGGVLMLLVGVVWAVKKKKAV